MVLQFGRYPKYMRKDIMEKAKELGVKVKGRGILDIAADILDLETVTFKRERVKIPNIIPENKKVNHYIFKAFRNCLSRRSIVSLEDIKLEFLKVKPDCFTVANIENSIKNLFEPNNLREMNGILVEEGYFIERTKAFYIRKI